MVCLRTVWVPRKLLLVFQVIAAGLVLANVAGIVSFHYLGASRLQLFNVDSDGTVPDFYAASILLFCAVLLGIIAVARKRERTGGHLRWAGLALVLMLLAIDEAANVHERLAEPLMDVLDVPQGAHGYVWILPYVVLLAILALLYVPFFLTLTPRLQRSIALAAVLFVAGAVGIELLGSYWWAEHDGVSSPIYELITTLEWSLQMAGVLVLASALVSYMTAPRQR